MGRSSELMSRHKSPLTRILTGRQRMRLRPIEPKSRADVYAASGFFRPSGAEPESC